MVRKRKVSLRSEEKENERNHLGKTSARLMPVVINGSIYTIMSKVQLNETFHKKYIKEIRQLYEKMDHNAFIFTFIKMIKTAMVAEENNEFAYTTLIFCAKFVSSFDGEDTHPLLADVCRWLLTTISNNPHIRFRLCQFVNMILNALGNEATLDDVICDSILEYMVERLVDISPSVRVQAILAMQRLQVPDNPDDPVLRSYQYHLCSDPSPRVRQAVVTSMGRNYHTIPYILDRLWDIDEKVRRHTYLHMSSYPVRSYKVSQRLTLLEQGLNDRSESIRKVVTNIMLQQWIESYQKDLVALLGALKLDSTDLEINRYRKIGKQVLGEIFKRQSKPDIVSCLSLEEEGEFYRCVPHNKLTLETAFYWQCLTEYLQIEMAEELDCVIPELSIFCAYVEYYCQSRKAEMDKFEAMEFQYILLSLMEILYTYDLGDEIGRGKLQQLLHHLLQNYTLEEKVIEVIVKCSENLITDQNSRHQFFLDIIHDICGLNAKQQDLVHERNLISELLANSTDADLNLKLSALKVKILDLEEQEMNYVKIKDYVKAQQIIEEKNFATEEFTDLLRPLLEKRNDRSGDMLQPQFSKVVKHESILRSLQITYYMVVSKRVKTLGHSSCRLYNDFIFRNIASKQIAIRDWALKCGAAFSMLYEPLAKDVFDELYAQFFKNSNIRIWETSITCIFELLDRYGVDSFAVQEEQSKVKKTGRQLYNTLELIDADEDTWQSTTLGQGQGEGVIYMMSHFLDTCDDVCILRAIINGFCRLILHGHIENRDIIEKLLIRYFNPATDPEINQILGVFLENLIDHGRQNLLQPCLMATVNSVLTASYDSPLHDIRPETITRFLIDATRPSAVSGNSNENLHNKLALVFLNEMLNNGNNKELCKLLAKELITLEVNVIQHQDLKNELKELSDKLIMDKFDPKSTKCIIDFKDILDGIFNLPPKRNSDGLESDEDEDTEKNIEAENVNTLFVTNMESIIVSNKASTEKTFTNSDEVASNSQDEIDNNILEVNKTAVSSLSSSNMPTTFDSDNIIHHRLLRKSLNISQNNLIHRNGTPNNNSTQNPNKINKIRIEARIDSDKKSQDLEKPYNSKRNKARRSLRYVNKNKGSNIADGILLSNHKAHEPEIIEKILSPTKKKPTSKSVNAVQHSSENQPMVEMIHNINSPQMQRKSTYRKKSQLENSEIQSTNAIQINTEHISTTNEEMNSLEIIQESPTINSTTTSLRVHTALRSMRSYALRSGSHCNGKTMDASAVNNVTYTPLRNGRKRVLRTSPQLFPSTSVAMSSPVRKQPCMEIDQSGPSVRPPTLKKTNKCGSMKLQTAVSYNGKLTSLEMKQKCLNSETKVDVTCTTPREKVISIFDKENEMSKSTKKNMYAVIQTDYKKTTTQRPVTVTRNIAKKELMSKIIVTRKRLSQENVTIQTLYSKAATNNVIGKSCIPVRTKKNDISAKKRIGSGKISPVISLRMKEASSSSSSSSTSNKLARQRNA